MLGSGFGHLYPAENSELAGKISEQGAVISELPLDRKPDKTTFPMRNRIVSALTLGTLVIEAGPRSGALLTARCAAEHDRIVFAVPGRIDAPGSRGPHGLIRDGARLVTGVDDVLEELECLLPRRKQDKEGTVAKPVVSLTLSDVEQSLVDLLEEGEQPVDTLIRGTQLPAARVNAVLIGLEMKKVVRMLPGRLVERVR